MKAIQAYNKQVKQSKSLVEEDLIAIAACVTLIRRSSVGALANSFISVGVTKD